MSVSVAELEVRMYLLKYILNSAEVDIDIRVWQKSADNELGSLTELKSSSYYIHYILI